MREPQKRYGQWLGAIIDRKYRLISPLGQGGMAMVFLAERLHLRDMVAIKLLQPLRSSDEDMRRRFQVEAAAAAKVKHPNVVTIYDFGFTEDGAVYIVMELLEGPGLDQEMHRNGRLSIARVLEIMKPVCSAIGAAHSVGLLHRDIKPPNIILHRGRYDISEVVKVVDFGIAKFFESTDLMVHTSEGIVLGTAEYMSPEQCQGLNLDARSDIYGLAMVCYQMLSGKLPFTASSTAEFLVKHVKESPIPLYQHMRDLPPGINAVIMQALDKIPQNRPPSAAEFIRRLEQAATQAQAQEVRTALNHNSGTNNSFASVNLEAGNTGLLVEPVEPAVKSAYLNPRFDCLVGRSSELNRLNEAWQRGCAGEGRPLLIMGEPGIGKTRLLEEFCKRVEETGAFVFQGRFYRTPGVRSFHVMIGDLKKFFIRLQAQPAEMRSIFGARAETMMEHLQHIWQTGNLVEHISNNDPESRSQYFNMLSQAFTMLAARRPLLLALDDIHWADDSARALIEYLTRSIPRERMLIVASARPVGDNDNFRSWLKLFQRECEMLTLSSLHKQQVFELLEEIFGRVVLNEPQFNVLMADCGGNPYFLIEHLRQLINEDRLKLDNQRWSGQELRAQLPRALSDLVELTLERLPESTRQLFEIAAVIGDEFELDLVQQLAKVDEDELDAGIQRGLELSLISTLPVDETATTRYRFGNATIRRVLYENTNKRSRRRNHRAVAKWLEAHRNNAVFELAHHYFEAAEWEQAFQQAIWAADAARENLQINDMGRYLGWADKSLAGLEALRAQESAALSGRWNGESPSESERHNLELLTSYRWLSGFNLIYRGRSAQAEQPLQQAIKLAQWIGNNRLLGQIYLSLGFERAGNGAKTEAVDFYKQALDLHRRSSYLEGQCQSLRHLSIVYEQRGDYTLALDCSRAAVEIAQAANQRIMESLSLSSEGWMLCKLRRFEDAAMVARQALSLARQYGDAAARCSAYNTIAQIYTDQGLYQDAINPQREAIRLARTLGNRRFELILSDNLGVIYFHMCKFPEAENYFLRVLKMVETGCHQVLEQSTLLNLVRVSIRLNKIPQARAYLGRAESLSAGIDLLESRCEFRAIAAELLLAEGRYRESIIEAEQSINQARTLGSLEFEWSAWLTKARALNAMERANQAKDAIARCVAAIEQSAAAISDEVAREKYLSYPERRFALELHAQFKSKGVSPA